ncbi:hypothetical protein [Chitinophaga sp. HK235]|uniref:hypothetical protein n=1 Tax=Chitinophaga sp. HK235 TaxID=2952571 RepID=UPI001BA5B2C0|nr:hypothetical protein [Chitinophaga sp. HK235]
MKYFYQTLLCLFLFVIVSPAWGQSKGSFTVKGDLDKYYPVAWKDEGWNNNTASELEIGRSSVHVDGDWRGSVIAKFRYHVTAWGNRSSFIEADIHQDGLSNPDFIAGWRDVSGANPSYAIVIWLRGNTTYFYTSRYTIAPPDVYDGVANSLPLVLTGEPPHTFKTTVDDYVNKQGKSMGALYLNGATNWTNQNWQKALRFPKGNALEMDGGTTKYGMGASTDNIFYFFSTNGEDASPAPIYRMIINYNGEFGIGTMPVAGFKMVVDGSLGARRIKVAQGNWADFVFHDDYKLPSLQDVETFIKNNKHLPDIPSEKEVTEKGLDVGEMNKLLLQKIEEMTLHMIKMEKRIQELESKQAK